MKKDQVEEAATKPGEQDEQPQDLITFMQSSPLAEAIAAGKLGPEWFERSRECGRDVELPDSGE